MTIYFFALITTMLIVLSLSVFNTNNIWKETLIAVVSALPLATVAGLRSLTIGTDLLVYGEFDFRMAQSYQSLTAYYNYITNINDTEYGYAFLNFFVSRFTDNLNTFLFVLALFTLVPFIIGILKMGKTFKVSPLIQLFLYFAIFYGLSLNEMRQMLAISWVFLAVSIMFQNINYKWIKITILWLISFSFHRTAVVGLVIFLMYIFFNTSKYKKWNVVIRSIVGILGLLFLVAVVYILKNGNLPDMFSKYTQYLNSSNAFSSRNIGMFRTLSVSVFPIISFILILSSWERNKSSDSNTMVSKNSLSFFLGLLSVDIVLLLGGISSAILPRIGQYFGIFETFLIPLSININVSKKGRWIFYVLIIAYYLFIFVYVTHSGENQIYPYAWILENN